MLLMASQMCLLPACAGSPEPASITTEIVLLPAGQRQLVSAYSKWPGDSFVCLVNPMGADGGYLKDSEKLLQSYAISEVNGKYSIQLLSERKENNLEKVLLLRDDNSTVSMAGRYGESRNPHLLLNGAATEEYQLPINFASLHAADLAKGEKTFRGNSVYYDEELGFVLVKSLDRHVKQFWLGREELQELKLPPGELRICQVEKSYGVFPGLLDELGQVFIFSSESGELELLADMEWLAKALQADGLAAGETKLNAVVCRDIAAFMDRKRKQLRIYMRDGRQEILSEFDPFEKVPGGGRRSERDANTLLDRPLLHLRERGKLKDDQVTSWITMLPLDDDTIAVVDRMYQRVLFVSPKETGE